MSNLKQWKTREVKIGSVGVGGDNPIRIQSMTTSSTRDVDATIEQIVRLADAGCEIARVTVQGIKEAQSCEGIKNGLLQKGYTIPLVADIHFFPPAAMHVVDFVDKVRINPGNYIDKRASFKTIEYDDQSYALEIQKIEEKFTPLVEKCKRLNRSMRIGTNHGSLSDRIMNRYGDTPKGMVESALEFARICRQQDYHNFLFSMKSSNPKVMIQAYRLLVDTMLDLGWDYPLHLGVTEAGAGEDGRVKSAIGIGTLLLDGIGDTIRVSLTEDPWYEIDPCQRLISFAGNRNNAYVPPLQDTSLSRSVVFPNNISLHRDGTVMLQAHLSPDIYPQLGCEIPLGQPQIGRSSVDCIVVSEDADRYLMTQFKEAGISVLSEGALTGSIRVHSLQEAYRVSQEHLSLDRFALFSEARPPLVVMVTQESIDQWELLVKINPDLIILAPIGRVSVARDFFNWLSAKQMTMPVIIRLSYTCSKEDLIIQAAAEYGSLFCEGFGEGIWIDAPHDMGFLRELSFNILQGARKRMVKTDFISCPSCGRTLFDLQDVSERIRSRTSHLPGVKIAIMGCIVNGPGEMADADFGYVGSKPGMIDLYVGKECVEKNISFAEADERLIELIKKQGRWIDV